MNEPEHQVQSSPEEEGENEQYYDQGEGYGNPPVMLFGEELKQALLEEFNVIFTKEYITTDPYLLYNMNTDFYAPISVIEDLPQIKALTFDTSVILQALRECDKVIVDEETSTVKPVCNLTQRNTIIIRDIPSTVPKEEILELFGGDDRFLSAIVETKYEYGDNYFIKFSDEDVTLEALSFLRDQTFKGKPVQARIKSENLRKSFYYNVPSSSYYYNGNNPYGETPSSNGDNRGFKSNQRSHDPKSPKGGRFGGNRRRDPKGIRRGRPPSKKNPPHEKNEHKPHSAFSMSNSHWPPLPVPSTTEEGKKLVAGYPGDFTKYNKDQFISIICALNNNNPSPKFETSESPALLENGQIHSELEILKPIPNGASVEFIESKQKNKSKGHKNPTKNDATASQLSGTTPGDTQKPNFEAKESETISPNPLPIISPPNLPATVWPAIDSSSVKTPPPPNHPAKKPPPPKQTRKPAHTAPTTANDKSSHPSQQPHSKAAPTSSNQKLKQEQTAPQQQHGSGKSKHFPAKHQKKATHPEGHSGSKPDHPGPQKSEVQASSGGSKDSTPQQSSTSQQSQPKEKSDRSYADIARSTTPTNTPSNTAVSD